MALKRNKIKANLLRAVTSDICQKALFTKNYDILSQQRSRKGFVQAKNNK